MGALLGVAWCGERNLERLVGVLLVLSCQGSERLAGDARLGCHLRSRFTVGGHDSQSARAAVVMPLRSGSSRCIC
jgi:hypothetical protein